MPRREFQLIEGSSSKFWAIELEGSAFNVHFGRIGTAGQAQRKEFDSAAAAQKEHDKLIAEKTRKGYTETGASPSAATPAAAPAPKVKPVKSAPKTSGEEAASSEEADPPPAPAKKAPAPSLTLERRVHLTKADHARAAWLPWEPLPAPKPEPFDFEKCLGRIKSALEKTSYASLWNLPQLLPAAATPEEAWLWLTALAAEEGGSKYYGRELAQFIEKKLRKLDFTVTPDFATVSKAVRKISNAQAEVIGLLRPLLTTREIVTLILDHISHPSSGGWYTMGLQRLGVPGFQAAIAPFLDAAARNEIIAEFSPHLSDTSSRSTGVADAVIGILACVGGGEAYTGFITRTQLGKSLHELTGLPTAEKFTMEGKRLSGGIHSPLEGRIWLLGTEWRELDRVLEAILAQGAKAEAATMARVLALVEAPEAAPHFLRVQLESKAPAVAMDWFAKYPLHAAVGLAPLARGQGKSAEAAKTFLQNLRRSDRRDVLEAALPHLDEQTADFVLTEILASEEDSLPEIAEAGLPADLRAAFGAVKAAKLPGWLTVAALPPLRLAEGRLAKAQLELLLAALQSPAENSAALFAALKKSAESHSLDAFAWALFSQWQAAANPSKDKWAMGALGYLGGDGSVLKLTPLIREWPGESQHQRAVFGLEVLRNIGTDAALMALNGIAQKVKFQGLKAKAVAMMEEIAGARGLTRDELADRIVPECGLDARGTRIFDFGSRQFRFVLGGDMKPLVRDAAGKTKPDLPSPVKTDDAAKAEAAIAEWKLLKKTLKETFKVQADRLEDVMISGRRWLSADFDTLLVRHPLMINLVRQLVWSAYGADGRPHLLFRVTEDQTLADENDSTVTLPPEAHIGVVHPAHLSEAQLSAWGQIFSDYEIIPPFQQLSRRICRPDPGDLNVTTITRYAGPEIPGITVYGMLERSHWLRDIPADGGGFVQHSKPFLAAGVTAFIHYDPGLSIGYYEEKQELKEIYFVEGHAKPDYWGEHQNRLKVKDVDPVVISEVLRLAEAIVAKAE